MKKLKLTILGFLIVVASQIVFTGCNTAHGFGEDMENTGQTIQEKADQHQ